MIPDKTKHSIDDSKDHEHHGFFRKGIDSFFVFILNHLPGHFEEKIKKTDKGAKEIIEKATTHHAIEILYDKGGSHHSRSLKEKIFNSIWQGTNNAKAVRNRLRVVTNEITRELTRLKKLSDIENIRMLSIAAGSARADIQAIKNSIPIGKELNVTFLDKNEEANTYSRELSQGITDTSVKFNWITNTIGKYLGSTATSDKFDLIEIVGLMDYFTDEKIIEVFSKIYKKLSKNGVVITSNIIDNKESRFITNVIKWKMLYKSPEQFAGLIEQAGFKKDKIVVKLEPLKIHTIVIAYK